MREIAALAFKDLRILFRDRSGFFFTLIWPLLIAVFFGTMFGGNRADEQASGIPVMVVDEDKTETSQAFVSELQSGGELEVTVVEREEAVASVRHRKAVAYVVLLEGFGEASESVFWGEAPRVELGIDPARSAEASMVEGILMKYASQRMEDFFSSHETQRDNIERARETLDESTDVPPEVRGNLERLFSDLDRFINDESMYEDTLGAGEGGFEGFQPVEVVRNDIATMRSRLPRSAYAITFPQGVIWGVIGASAGFAVSIVVERTRGTLFRLQTAPISRMHILGGKALACFISTVTISAFLFALAFVAFGVRPGSIPLLALAIVSSSVAFVGIMMLLSVSGRTEQAVGGIGWAVLIVMSMLGGGMIPLFFMPGIMRTLGNASPVKWSILAMEGAVWRQFSLVEMFMPCGILLAVGVVCFTVGVRVFDWTSRA
jgi:ABC-2 type transport system permease protein